AGDRGFEGSAGPLRAATHDDATAGETAAAVRGADRRRGYWEDPSVTSPLCAANAARTSPFSLPGTLKKSSERPSSAATSSNWSGEIFSARWASSKPRRVRPGFVAA